MSAVTIVGSWMGLGQNSISVEPTSTPLVSALQIEAARLIPKSLDGGLMLEKNPGLENGVNVPVSCCLRRPGGRRFRRTFEIDIGLERRVDNVTAFRRSWPPPSQKPPSM